MYDDAFFSFAAIPQSTQKQQQPQPQVRRQSLLDPPIVDQADGNSQIDLRQTKEPVVPPTIALPSPAVPQRARSITDFHKIRRRPKHEAKESEDHGLATELDFANSYSDVADALADASHERYQIYLDQLSLTRRHLDSLLEDTTSNLKLLSDLTTSFKAVEAQTSSFQTRSKDLLEEQQRTSVLAEDIGENLQYYNLLDPLTKRLNAPGAGSLVRSYDFPQMLENLDGCLDFMRDHPKHKEASQYESRYRLLMTRALTLIRVHFTNTLREISSDVSRRVAEASVSDTAMTGLLYAKFRVGASELRDLGLEVQKRAVPAPGAEPGAQGEYQSLVNELHQSYAAARGRLLTPMIHNKLAELNGTPNNMKDLITFARSTIGYVRGLCLDEYDLWHEWFDGEAGLYEFLESLCEPLYDYLRPRTIKETQLQKLCEMCSLIQVRYMDEAEDEMDPAEEVPRLQFSPLIRPALEDAQTRLVFLAVAVLRDDIERYRPKPIDLETAGRRAHPRAAGGGARPPALSGRKTSTLDVPQSPATQTPTADGSTDVDPFDIGWSYEGGAPVTEWYPTLRKAIWLLSRIYRLVNSIVFDDLAHQIVHNTTLSLIRASSALLAHTPSPASGLPRVTPVDAQLFLLKQLLILKQQIVAFDIEYISPSSDLDFTTLTSTFTDFRSSGTTGALTSLFANLASPSRLIGGIQSLVPRVVENMLDAKSQLDTQLRSIINDFTATWALRMTFPLGVGGDAMAQALAAQPLGATPSARSLQLQAQKGKLPGPAAVAGARTAIEREVPLLRAKLDEWLEDVRVKETLVGAVEDAALANYEEFYGKWVREEGGGGGGAESARRKKGKGRENEVWEPGTFADWMGSVFGVERVGVGMGMGMEGEMDGREDEGSRAGRGGSGRSMLGSVVVSP